MLPPLLEVESGQALPRGASRARLGLAKNASHRYTVSKVGMKKSLAAFANQVRPLIRMETLLANDAAAGRSPLTKPEYDIIFYALALAKLRVLNVLGRDVDVDEGVRHFRERLGDALRSIVLENHGAVDYGELRRLLPNLAVEIERIEERLLRAYANDFGREHLLYELTQKDLVLVLGGGGGAGYVYLGAFVALEQFNLRPAYLVGTSMGAIMAVLRGVRPRFDIDFALDIIKGLRWRDVFKFMTMESRYGLPATLRLYLHDALQHHFLIDGEPMRLDHLDIPAEVIVAGIKKGGLPHDLSYYERMLDWQGQSGPLQVLALRKRIGRIYDTLKEFLSNPSILHEVVVGRDPLTAQFDAIDAVGFSSAIPGVIHYDVVREDPRMHTILQTLMEQFNLLRLVDGGVVSNVPARSAWLGVQEGKIRRRNAFILALDCFAPSFNANLLFAPIQHLVQQNVKRDRPYAHFVKAFHDVLSPLNLVPRYEKVVQAVARGKRAMEKDIAFVRKMLEPIEHPSYYRARGLDFNALTSASPPLAG